MVKTPIIWICCASIEMKFKKKKINIKSFQMLFEQNIASNVTRNQESKHITNLNIPKAPPSMPKHLKQLFGI